MASSHSLLEIINIFKKYNHFIISSHVSLDGDAVGSEMALFYILESLHKDVRIINQDKVPAIYQFLPDINQIISVEEKKQDFSFEIKKGTILVVLDSSNLERIGDIGIDTSQIELIINIDHHPSNTGFGHYNYIDSEASSVGEILFELAEKMACNISYAMAISLYTAIITDTGSFRFANTTSKTFRAALHLVKKGVNPSNIAHYIYNNNEISKLKLLGEALQNMNLNQSFKISWTVITQDMLKKAHSKEEETEGIVDKILSVKTVQVAVFFKETKDAKTKISFRSKGNFNVDYFARIFNGGGHANAAGCQMKGSIKEITDRVIKKLEEELELAGIY